VESFRINRAKIPKEQVYVAAPCLVAISLRASMAARHVTGINGIAIVAIVVSRHLGAYWCELVWEIVAKRE
jgi:hypothetical protein